MTAHPPIMPRPDRVRPSVRVRDDEKHAEIMAQRCADSVRALDAMHDAMRALMSDDPSA